MISLRATPGGTAGPLMEALHYRLIERLLQDPQAFSRNPNFDRPDEPGMQRARRIHRHLRSLESDLLQAAGDEGEVSVEDHALGFKISVRFKNPSGSRI